MNGYSEHSRSAMMRRPSSVAGSRSDRCNRLTSSSVSIPASARTSASASRCGSTGNIACVTVPKVLAMIGLQNSWLLPRSGSTSPASHRFQLRNRLAKSGKLLLPGRMGLHGSDRVGLAPTTRHALVRHPPRPRGPVIHHQ
jgi:hypothetical protein